MWFSQMTMMCCRFCCSDSPSPGRIWYTIFSPLAHTHTCTHFSMTQKNRPYLFHKCPPPTPSLLFIIIGVCVSVSVCVSGSECVFCVSLQSLPQKKRFPKRRRTSTRKNLRISSKSSTKGKRSFRESTLTSRGSPVSRS